MENIIIYLAHIFAFGAFHMLAYTISKLNFAVHFKRKKMLERLSCCLVSLKSNPRAWAALGMLHDEARQFIKRVAGHWGRLTFHAKSPTMHAHLIPIHCSSDGQLNVGERTLSHIKLKYAFKVAALYSERAQKERVRHAASCTCSFN